MLKNAVVQTREIEALRRSMGETIRQALMDPKVVEVMVNPDGRIWIDRVGEGRSCTDQALTADKAESTIRLVANHIGETVTAKSPMVSGTLPVSGERFQGMLPPLVRVPSFTIRKRPELIWTLADYVEQEIMTEAEAEVIRIAVACRKNVLIAGGTGSGKTTLANAILTEPAFKNDRVVIIEDTPELQCAAEDRIELLAKASEPVVTIRDLVRTSLRLRPDRIVIGEVREGGAALEMLKAWNTGHPGGVGTIHSNSAEDAVYRLEDLISEVVTTVPHRTIANAIDLIVFIRRSPEGRVIDGITKLESEKTEGYVFEEIVGT